MSIKKAFNTRAAARRRQRRLRARIALFMLAGGVLLVFAGLLALGERGPLAGLIPDRGTPRLQVSQDFVDLGAFWVGEPAQVTFTLTNTGDCPLRIKEQPYVEVVEGCCPPVPAVSSSVIMPGEQASLTLAFTMHAGMGGPHDFRVHLQTNDPAAPERELVVLSDWLE